MKRKGKREWLLVEQISSQHSTWSFNVPGLESACESSSQLIKSLSVVSNAGTQGVTLRLIKCEPNRIVSIDPLHKFVLITFSDFRLRVLSENNVSEPASSRESAEYISKVLENGISINGSVYNFYGHSNSQLKSRSCYLFAASKEDIAQKISGLGDFSKLKTAAKLAKRIGLLFSTAEMGVCLPQDRYEDIPDIQNKDYNFTDGCGLISVLLSKQLVKRANISFRNKRYTPSVFQIRYRGYKGVLTLEPKLKGQILAQFRDSMRKFKDATDLTLSVVDYSKPYSCGYLNDEIILLLRALGISEDTLLRKQHEYLEYLSLVETLDPRLTFQYLSSCDRAELAETVLLSGAESVRTKVHQLVKEEHAKWLDKRGEQRSRIRIPQSRLLFGVSDPYDVLKQGQCFVRVTTEDDGDPKTLIGAEVLVTRNPCLHPGDLQKFKLADIPELSHLVDCIVFSTQGKRPSADMLSGGDLDGDKFFVCWDRDIVPSSLAEAANYPAPPEPVSFGTITYSDRISYFARYTSASLGQIKNLFLEWARLKGPMSSECQQLNRLFSQCVDGNRIRIPEHFRDLPSNRDSTPFILDSLHEASKEYLQSRVERSVNFEDLSFDALRLLSARDRLSFSEFELFKLVYRWCLKNKEDIGLFCDYFDFNLLNDAEKAWALTVVPPTKLASSNIMNGLMQSNILDPRELVLFQLDHPGLRWKRIFDSASDRTGTFLHRLSQALEMFHKKLVIFRLDERMSIAVYIPQQLERQKECSVDATVRVFALPHSQGLDSPRYEITPTKVNYRLYCDSSTFQLYELKRINTWIFLTRGPQDESSYRNIKSVGDRRRQQQATINAGVNYECRASIALQKISAGISKHMGRVNRQGILGAEIYVISNRDVKGLRTVDLWLEHVDTQQRMPLYETEPQDFTVPELATHTWAQEPTYITSIVRDGNMAALESISAGLELRDLIAWLLRRNERVKIQNICDYLIGFCSSLEGGLNRPDVFENIFQLLPEVPFAFTKLLQSDAWNHSKSGLESQSATILPRVLLSLLLQAHMFDDLVLRPFGIALAELKVLKISQLSELVETIALTAPSIEFALDILLKHLQPEISRLTIGSPAVIEHFSLQLFGVALEHLNESFESKAVAPQLLSLAFHSYSEGDAVLESKLRIDAPSSFPLTQGDHIKLKPAAPPQNRPLEQLPTIDATVIMKEPGMGRFRCLQPPPMYFEDCSWKMKNCGSFTTSKTMIDALVSLMTENKICCKLYAQIINPFRELPRERKDLAYKQVSSLNPSQNRALEAAMTCPMSLLWGPPGTGKTHTVVEILQQLLTSEPNKRILVAAPTHNAVDNILRKFIGEEGHLKTKTPPIRVSTDVRKVSSDLKNYTCDAMMGKDLRANPQGRNKAQKRIKECRLIFTTCIGANLGLLKGEQFEIVLIDEASQQTEAMCLVPMVKGCERAVLVGDHVQLRATTSQYAELVGFDVSLFERLYLDKNRPDVQKVMLDTQYRMHGEICQFSSTEFYNSELKTGVSEESRPIAISKFPWPEVHPGIKRARKIFIQCHDPEDLGRKSKSNKGQAALCHKIHKLLTTTEEAREPVDNQSIVVLTPYTRQIELLQRAMPNVDIYSIDGYQGREADIVIFVTVRCNERREMGFLKDMRRLNVAMTRARSGVIIIGDEATLGRGDEIASAAIWARLINSCAKVQVVSSDS